MSTQQIWSFEMAAKAASNAFPLEISFEIEPSAPGVRGILEARAAALFFLQLR
jgi:hypothetical protein